MKQALTKVGRMGKQHWTVDKRVPLALIITLMVQTGGAIWWAATISGRVNQLEKSQQRSDDEKLGERMKVVEVLVQQVAASTDRIERQVADSTNRIERQLTRERRP